MGQSTEKALRRRWLSLLLYNMAEAPRTPLPSGYDDSFVDAVEDENICSICHLTLKEPVLTRCGHRFCKECLEEYFRRKEIQDQPLTCPLHCECLDRDRDVFPDKATKRKIFSFAIKCPSEGCDWTGELRSKEAHLASCLFKIVPCTNENCHVTVQRKHLKEHEIAKCPWRILECDHCSEPHPECTMKDHIEQCSKFPVSCPNSCGASIPREMIPNHTEYDCPLTIISCPYEKMGCESLVQRVQVESHLQSAVRLHLDLACVKLTNTEAKLTNTEAKLTNTEAKLIETKENIEATREVVEKLGTRIFIWKINDFIKKLRLPKNEFHIDSVPFYTDRTESYGYKLKARIFPYKDEHFGLGDIMTVGIVLMKGEYDAILPWPLKKKVKITLIDQQMKLVERENIMTVLIPENNQNAFARPVKEENEQCFCFYVPHEKLYSRRYLVDDTLFLQVEVSPP